MESSLGCLDPNLLLWIGRCLNGSPNFAMDSSVRTGYLLEDILGKERKSGFGIWLFDLTVSF